MRKFLLVIAATFLMPLTAYAGALDWANGEWALDPTQVNKDEQPEFRCGNETLKTRITADNVYSYWWDNEKNIKHAKIISESKTTLTIQYEGEERLMDNGKPHVWLMVFLDEDHFAWVREDWVVDGKIKGGTSIRIRCENAGVS